MSTDYMITCPKNRYTKAQWWKLIEDQDVHKWVIGFEEGKNGYRHLQGRLRLSETPKEGFVTIKHYLPDAHIEQCSNTWEYERKSGRFLSSDDTPEVRKTRFGKLTWQQAYVVEQTLEENDRQIVVWYDEMGCSGKSWLLSHLFETAQAWVVQATDTVKGMTQDVASEYIRHGWRPIIVIDIPRTWKWTKDLYVALERIKDGLIKDTRYQSQTINIRGVKVLVTTNTRPKADALSADRWNIIEF